MQAIRPSEGQRDRGLTRAAPRKWPFMPAGMRKDTLSPHGSRGCTTYQAGRMRTLRVQSSGPVPCSVCPFQLSWKLMAPPSEEQAIAVVVRVEHTLPVAGHICVVLAVGRGHRGRPFCAWLLEGLSRWSHMLWRANPGGELLSHSPALRRTQRRLRGTPPCSRTRGVHAEEKMASGLVPSSLNA